MTLILPTLNEIGGLKEIMPRIKPEWVEQLIMVDGGSTDGTVEYGKEHGYQVISQKRKGMRWAYLEALPYVKGDIIITFSPDGNSVPELLPALLDQLEKGYDMVTVSRYLGSAKSYDDSFITRLANKTFTYVINLLFGAKYTDAMVIYRGYKMQLVGLLDLDKDGSYSLAEKLVGKPLSWEMLLNIRCAKRKLRVTEIPGDEPCRIGGRRRLHVAWGFGYLIQLLREVFVWR